MVDEEEEGSLGDHIMSCSLRCGGFVGNEILFGVGDVVEGKNIG